MQGDILELLVDDAEGWNRWGIVVTADCDILRDKHGGRLTYVPVVSVKTYLSEFFFPQRLKRQGEAIGERLVARIRAHHPVSGARALDWVVDAGIETVITTLDVQDPDERDEMVRLGTVYQSITVANRQKLGEQWEAYLAARRVIDPRFDRDNAIERLMSEMVSAVRSLPGDAFFLNSLGGQRNSGYVCYLRVLREIAASKIALRPFDLTPEIEAQRIGHLTSPFKYKLTQQLAEVFASIALPQEYEESRDLQIAELRPTPRQTSD
jgi:hypothetical protein